MLNIFKTTPAIGTPAPAVSTHAVGSAAPAPRERLTWIIELMSRYASEKCNSHDSARLAAAIVTHLKSLAADLTEGSLLADTVSHWLDAWEPILDRHVATQRADASALPSLTELVMRARDA